MGCSNIDIYNDLDAKKKNQYKYNALDFISTVKREIISAEELADDSENIEYQLYIRLKMAYTQFVSCILFHWPMKSVKRRKKVSMHNIVLKFHVSKLYIMIIQILWYV